MKKLALSLAILAMAGVASADIYVPNGQFETGDATDWSEAAGGGGGATFQYPTSGGVGDSGYGQIDSTAGAWAVWVAQSGGSEEISLSYFGVSAGDTITVTMDMIELANAGGNTAGIKMESWAGGAHISNSGDMKVAVGSSWDTYTWDYTIDAAATHIKFVPVQHDDLSVGYDNVGVVPEPATLGLFGLMGGAMLFIRRRARR